MGLSTIHLDRPETAAVFCKGRGQIPLSRLNGGDRLLIHQICLSACSPASRMGKRGSTARVRRARVPVAARRAAPSAGRQHSRRCMCGLDLSLLRLARAQPGEEPSVPGARELVCRRAGRRQVLVDRVAGVGSSIASHAISDSHLRTSSERLTFVFAMRWRRSERTREPRLLHRQVARR